MKLTHLTQHTSVHFLVPTACQLTSPEVPLPLSPCFPPRYFFIFFSFFEFAFLWLSVVGDTMPYCISFLRPVKYPVAWMYPAWRYYQRHFTFMCFFQIAVNGSIFQNNNVRLGSAYVLPPLPTMFCVEVVFTHVHLSFIFVHVSLSRPTQIGNPYNSPSGMGSIWITITLNYISGNVLDDCIKIVKSEYFRYNCK